MGFVPERGGSATFASSCGGARWTKSAARIQKRSSRRSVTLVFCRSSAVSVANIKQHHCLDVVDVVNTESLQLKLDDLQELTMKALDQRNHFEVEVVHCKPLVRPFPRRWARRRPEREMYRPVYMFTPGLRRDPSKKRPSSDLAPIGARQPC